MFRSTLCLGLLLLAPLGCDRSSDSNRAPSAPDEPSAATVGAREDMTRGLRVVGMHHAPAFNRLHTEVVFGDGHRVELTSHATRDSLRIELRSITEPDVPPYVLHASADWLKRDVDAHFGYDATWTRALEHDGRVRQLIDPTGAVLFDPTDEELDALIPVTPTGQRLATLLTHADFRPALEAFIGHPINPMLGRFNLRLWMCGSAAIVGGVGVMTGNGPAALVGAGGGILCGTMIILEDLGANWDYDCPGDFDCDGIPDEDESDPSGGGADDHCGACGEIP